MNLGGEEYRGREIGLDLTLETKTEKSGPGKSDQNHFFHILARFSTLLTWNIAIRPISFEAAESQLFKAVKILEIGPLLQKLCIFL